MVEARAALLMLATHPAHTGPMRPQNALSAMPYRPQWKAGRLTSAGAQISRICVLPRSVPPSGFAG
jgi:hypothetical protein